MLGTSRWNSIDDVFTFQRQLENSPSFQVTTTNAKIGASYRHGMLQLTLPLKASVKPRRIPIDGVSDQQKQIASAA